MATTTVKNPAGKKISRNGQPLPAKKLDLHKALQDHFGFDKFKGNQEKIIESVLAGQDTFVIMPTGGGKSLCYQLPGIVSDGLAIILSPLIALMKNPVYLVRLIGSTM